MSSASSLSPVSSFERASSELKCSRAKTEYAVTLVSSGNAIEMAGANASTVAKLPFHSFIWLSALFETIAPGQGAWQLTMVVSDAMTGGLALCLPLALRREHGLVVASFPDFGVSDYGGPMIGPAAPTDSEGGNRLWRNIRAALKGADLIRLEKMPREIGGRTNPLALADACMPSPHHGHFVTITGTVEEFLRSRGKKFRKEVERCFRHLHEAEDVAFRRAETSEAIETAYAKLEAQQSTKQHAVGSTYVLDDPCYSAFYRQVISEGSPGKSAHLFTLSANGETVATLFGVSEGSTFTLLRISNAGERWKHISPGRLIVVEAMRYFVKRGVRTFDMGIGDYAFKRGFGADDQPLYDLVAARTIKAIVPVAMLRLKAKVRQGPKLSGLIRRLRGHKAP